MTHTPGPWHLLSELDGDGDILRICQTHAPSPGFHIALVYGHGGDIEHDTERTANAHLIAAAPDLLAAAKAILQPGDNTDSAAAWQALAAAVTKAKGD
jgi:hypothetical protein